MKTRFTKKLIQWHLNENKRIMPWKGEKDPYKIWISEIILQQTRVKQGLSYYNNFISKFPDLKSLASANDEEVFKVWEGLGYYTRCKNILFAARSIVYHFNGEFPDTYKNILALKGVGPYTAAAISSFAYGLPHAVVDGNVFRVLARFFGEAAPIDSVKGKQFFSKLANDLLFTEDSAAYNQAIMDFGATVCKPQIPDCQICVLRNDCIALNNDLVNKLPVKEKQLLRKKRWFTYFVFNIAGSTLVKKRTGKDIWQNLFEFYLYETEKEWMWTPEKISDFLSRQLGIGHFNFTHLSKVFTQQLTHQDLHGRFIIIELFKIPDSLQNYISANSKMISALSFPKFINQYMQAQQLSLLPFD